MLKNMLKGDTFSGQIINVSDGNALLQLTNGSLINAKLAESAKGLANGQIQTFIVDGQSSDGITVKLLGTKQQENVIISKALEAAGLDNNEENAGLVKMLLSLNMPIVQRRLVNWQKQFLNFLIHQMPLLLILCGFRYLLPRKILHSLKHIKVMNTVCYLILILWKMDFHSFSIQ